MTMSTARLIFDDKKRVGQWVADQVEYLAEWGGYYAMGVELNGEIVSGTVIQSWTDTNVVSYFAVARPTKLLPALFDHTVFYTFAQLGVRRMTAFVSADNEKSMRLTSHIGFVTEGVMREAQDNGADLCVRVLWPENYTRSRRHGQKE